MRSRSDRLRTTAAILALTLALTAAAFAVGFVLSERLLWNVALGVFVLGGAVFAPLYLLYASWLDETEGLEGGSRPAPRGGTLESRSETDSDASSDASPLETLHQRYVDGDLSDAGFERELERVLGDGPVDADEVRDELLEADGEPTDGSGVDDDHTQDELG